MLEKEFADNSQDPLELEDRGTWFREYEIAHGLRLDFLNYNFGSKLHAYHIIEVKISADTASLAQLSNYSWVFNKHIRHQSPKRTTNFDGYHLITTHLIARTFDRYVYSLAAELGVRLWRIDPVKVTGGERLSIKEETHPMEETPLDTDFLETLFFKSPLGVVNGTH